MSTKVVIKDVIGSYVYLREARENQNGEKDYSMQIILPKNHPQVEQIKKIRTARKITVCRLFYQRTIRK